MKREIKITFTEGTGKDAITTEKVFKNLNNKDKRISDYSTKLMTEDAQNFLTERTASLLVEDAKIKTKLTIRMLLEKAVELDITVKKDTYPNLMKFNYEVLFINSFNQVEANEIVSLHDTDVETVAIVEGKKIIFNNCYTDDHYQATKELIEWIKENK